jgi:hypothetical protein
MHRLHLSDGVREFKEHERAIGGGYCSSSRGSTARLSSPKSVFDPEAQTRRELDEFRLQRAHSVRLYSVRIQLHRILGRPQLLAENFCKATGVLTRCHHALE